MLVYLAEYEIYKDDYGVLCNPQNGSAVFLDLDNAYKSTMDEINSFIESREETRTWWEDYEFSYGGYFRIYVRDTEDHSLNIEYNYHLNGEFASRSKLWGHYWHLDMPETGRYFKRGDVVRLKGHKEQRKDELFVIRSISSKGYCDVVFLSNEDYVMGRLPVHTIHLEPYSGEVPANIKILSGIFKGEIKISLGRLKEVFGENQTFKDQIEHDRSKYENMTDDSTDTTHLVEILLLTHCLVLPNAHVYRLIEKGDVK